MQLPFLISTEFSILVKGIIFDFDGVISQSITAKTNAFKKIYECYGNEIVKKVVKHHESNGGVSRFEKFSYYHKSFLNKNISEEEISFLSNQFSNLVIGRVINSPYVPGALEYIEKSFDNYQLFISTGTPQEEIKKIIKEKNIQNYFKEVYGSPANKISHINIIMKKYNLSSSELRFFGDSNTDFEAARHFNIDFTLISNNHNKRFQSNYKGKIINNFKELLN